MATFPTNTPNDTRRHGGLISSPSRTKSRTSFVCSPEKKKKLATRKIISLYPSPTDSKKTRSPPLPEPDWCCWWVLSVSQFPQPQQPISRGGRTVFPKNDPNKRSVPGRFRRVNTSIYGEKKNSLEKVKLPGRAAKTRTGGSANQSRSLKLFASQSHFRAHCVPSRFHTPLLPSPWCSSTPRS